MVSITISTATKSYQGTDARCDKKKFHHFLKSQRLFEHEVSDSGFEVPINYRDRRKRRELLVQRMRSILTKSMKDSVVRGCLLHLLYERQREGPIPFGHAEQAVPPPGGISPRDWLRAVAQLSEYRLIDWTPLEDKSGMGLLSGFAKINDFGVKVLKAGVEPPIRISMDES
jgi:hypothetical protein